MGEALRGAARPEARARDPRRRPRRPRRRQGAHRRVPGRAQAAPGARHRRGPALGRDPHPRRSSGNGQDVDRRVDRARAGPRVRPHVARRRARRGRDPRPPPHLHRRDARPDRPGAARRGNDEPGDHARRGRQGRRRLARRSVGGAARGARPGAEPHVPRPLPRRRARPVAGAVHRHGERRRDDPGAAARPHGSHPLRRLHRRGEGRDRARLPVAAQLERNGLRHDEVEITTSVLRTVVVRLHARGRRAAARARARQDAAQGGDADRVRRRRGADRDRRDAVREALGRQRFWHEAAERTAGRGSRPGWP